MAEAEPVWVKGNQEPATVIDGLAKYEVPEPSIVTDWDIRRFNTLSPYV